MSLRFAGGFSVKLYILCVNSSFMTESTMREQQGQLQQGGVAGIMVGLWDENSDSYQ